METTPLTTNNDFNARWYASSRMYDLVMTEDNRDVIIAESGKFGKIVVCDVESLEVRHVLNVTGPEDPGVDVHTQMTVAGNFLVAYVCHYNCGKPRYIKIE